MGPGAAPIIRAAVFIAYGARKYIYPLRHGLIKQGAMSLLCGLRLSADRGSMVGLSRSVVASVFLLWCSQGSYRLLGGRQDVVGAARWASMVVILFAIYYLQCKLWLRVMNRRNEVRTARGVYRQTVAEDVDLDSLPRAEEEGLTEGVTVVSGQAYYPELTVCSVWTYVYGWGLLLFVSVYCLSGLELMGSCWWLLGMHSLIFDELISRGMGRYAVLAVVACMFCAVFCMWCGVALEGGKAYAPIVFSGDTPVLSFVLGAALPVLSPFLFFSVRHSVRGMTKDAFRLCEIALPFMLVLGVCFLMGTSGMCYTDTESLTALKGGTARRGLLDFGQNEMSSYLRKYTDNQTQEMVETVAKFSSTYSTDVRDRRITFDTLAHALIFISPIAAFFAVYELINSIVASKVAEFLTGYLLVSSVRFAVEHDAGYWSGIALAGAGLAFLFILLCFRSR